MAKNTKRPDMPVEAIRAASQLGRTVNRALVDGPLTPAGYRLLAYLSTGEQAAKVLAAKLAVSRPTITTTLDWLEPRGFVTRKPDPSDKRRVSISITPKGREALEEGDRLVGQRLSSVLEGLDHEDATLILGALERLHDVLNAFRARDV